MIEGLFPIASLLSYGTNNTVLKKALNETGWHQSIIYVYLTIAAILSLVFFFGDYSLYVPDYIVPLLLLQILIGTVAILARYKALEMGRTSVITPLSKLNVIIVFAAGIFVFGESASLFSIIGVLLVLTSGVILAVDNGKFEKGSNYLAITIILWGIYFSMLKIFVETLGVLQTTLVLEAGIMLSVWGYCAIRKKNLHFPEKGGKMVILSGMLAACGTYMYNLSIEAIGIAITGAIVAATPVINAILARIFLDEKLSISKYLAVLLTVIGVVLLAIFK